MNLTRRFLDFVSEEKLFSQKEHLLLAVSGGVDSVVLASLCASAGLTFSLAHCNFKLRGEESERDEVFVRELGLKYGVEVYVALFDTLEFAKNKKLSVQVAARHLRYNWFNQLVGGDWKTEFFEKDEKPSKVADLLLTAHHADDNIETVVMNFFKGSGISGIRGMLPRHGKHCRPILFARKPELMEYALAKDLRWVEDSSNSSEKYSRNKFRNSILPAIEEIYPQAFENLLNNIGRFRDTELLYRERIDNISRKILIADGKQFKIPVLRLKQFPARGAIIFEITRAFNFTPAQVNEILDLLNAETGKFVESATHRVIRHRNMLVIAEKEGAESGIHVISEHDSSLSFADLRMNLSFGKPGVVSDDPGQAFLDADKMIFPLILRKRRPSDYFYPLGMHKKKKVSRFLSDKKLSLVEKENTWLLEMDKKIIWVVGLRIDDRFKVNLNTKRILKITFIGNG